MPEAKVDEELELSEEDSIYHPYLKQELNLHVICDTSVYEQR